MGRTRKLIDELIEKKARGDSFQLRNVKIKLLLKGIMLDNITYETPDTYETIDKIFEVAKDFKIELNS